MKGTVKCVALITALFIAAPAMGIGLNDIQKSKLPHDSTVLKAYASVEAIESYVQGWEQNWTYPIPKSEVVTQIKSSLAAIQQALLRHPQNEELWLLTGLTAHYAYNVDVEADYRIAEESFRKAHELAPEDYRSEWFLGVHECEAAQLKQGTDKLLSLEQAFPWKQLPYDFWDDYLFCANLADMPAHALRAGDRAIELGAPASDTRSFLMEAARKRFKVPDPLGTYPIKEVWDSDERDSGASFFWNSMFGFGFVSKGDWKLQLPDVQKGVCAAVIHIGPYHGKVGDVFPEIVVIVRQPKQGETLQDFITTISSDQSAEPSAAPGCPFPGCLGAELVRPGMYKAEGNGHFVIFAFRRDQPEYPGLLFEEPSAPTPTKNSGVQYFRPVSRFKRLQGTLYYFVGLDTAASVLQEAKRDYKSFLKTLQVE